ncbi:MAG TPA: NAD-dependent epimerase/dehydratase family protein [Vicinamibacterales bacterium]|nr:NAD-dependent epimerase/dehydratase family protein [Vicinamibacterales bacterium]
MSGLRGVRVLVTGATGFIGGRLVERLVREEGASVRALVRNFANAPRIARFAIEMVPGDLLSPVALDRAVARCDVVFHCAYGALGPDAERRVVNVQGTESVLAAALAHHCRRVVHVSTMSVYGDPASGDIDETAPRKYTGSAYGDSKIDAENAALGYCDKGLSVAVVQPTIVYGPWALTWTIKPLQQLQTGRVILVNDGTGTCNPVYIDDVVTAMIAAAGSAEAHKQAFLISGNEPVTWRAFFERYQRMLPASATVAMTAEQARAHFEASEPKGFVSETVRVLRREVRKREALIRERLSPTRPGRIALTAAEGVSLLSRPGTAPAAVEELPVPPLAPSKVPMFAAQARFRSDKATALLGYHPAFDLDRGMAMTEAWARWGRAI